ncbi:hypothetical protein FOA52_009364 [Chlamydomonas sp. UWO 241]|nr:hypothetical protein FOA52_009364 [Chlamydomonas sp. UWO 241]
MQVASAGTRSALHKDDAAVALFGNVAKVAAAPHARHHGIQQRNWHALGLAYTKQRNLLEMGSASKMVAIRTHHMQSSLNEKRMAELVVLSVLPASRPSSRMRSRRTP